MARDANGVRHHPREAFVTFPSRTWRRALTRLSLPVPASRDDQASFERAPPRPGGVSSVGTSTRVEPRRATRDDAGIEKTPELG
jgi:hypothetical protein